MPTHAEKRVLPHSPEQMFDLVADIETYPQFLPWCLSARVDTHEDEEISAEMAIGFKMFRENFITKVTMDKPRRIDVVFAKGPFRYLNNHWVFEPAENGGCEVDFFVDFEFRSRLLQGMIGPVFNEAVRLMVSAFEKRAKELYG